MAIAGPGACVPIHLGQRGSWRRGGEPGMGRREIDRLTKKMWLFP